MSDLDTAGVRHAAHTRAGTRVESCPLCQTEMANIGDAPEAEPEFPVEQHFPLPTVAIGAEEAYEVKEHIVIPEEQTMHFLGAAPQGLSGIPADDPYDPSEQPRILEAFKYMLGAATKDGGRKRASGEKPPWFVDKNHFPAVISHVNKYVHGETRDKDSGAHTLIHCAWRCLAIAYQETYGKRDPISVPEFALLFREKEID